MLRNGCKFALLAGLLLLVTPLFANNLIYNGDFTPYNGDTPTEPTSSDFCGPFAYCVGYYNLGQGGKDYIGSVTSDLNGTAWMLLPATPSGFPDIMVLGSQYTEPLYQNGNPTGTLQFTPLAGTQQSLDLTGEGNEGDNDGVKQQVSTVAGHMYDLSFYLGHQYGDADGYSNGPAALTLYINGQDVGVFQNDLNTNVDNITWQLDSYQFLATGDSTTIAFQNATAIGNNYAGLDGVSLYAVPEPATFVLLVTGLAGVLLLLPRRQKIALFPLRAPKRG